jgi:hypothetical protein
VRSNALAIISLAFNAPALVCGQAWLPAGGEGSVSLNYLGMITSDHLLGSGQPLDRGPMEMHTLTVGVLYGITNRLAISAEVPYIASKFNLTPGLAPNAHDLDSKIDDGRYQATFQDFRGSVRFNALKAPFMLTPFYELVVPTHHYTTFGHSAPGKYLHENHVGFDIGRLLNPILPRAYFDLRYTYVFVPKLDGFNIDRNNVDLEVGYFWKPSIALRGIGSVQKTLGGLESLVAPDNPYFCDHDRLERGHYFRIGGGITFTLPRKLDLYVLVISTLSGKNIQAFTAPVIGVSWNFRTRKSRENVTQRAMDDQRLAASNIIPAPRCH